MMSTVIGGAMLPRAPQFFTMPNTEDAAVVARVREVAADIGERLRALKPDPWIIFSNDHAEQFFHITAPPFGIHVGGEATGEFAGRKFHWRIPSEAAFELVRQLCRQNFDPAFSSTACIRCFPSSRSCRFASNASGDRPAGARRSLARGEQHDKAISAGSQLRREIALARSERIPISQ